MHCILHEAFIRAGISVWKVDAGQIAICYDYNRDEHFARLIHVRYVCMYTTLVTCVDQLQNVLDGSHQTALIQNLIRKDVGRAMSTQLWFE